MELITGLIDIHNHVIPYLDDGARDMDTALKMLRMYAEQGVSGLICTPHYHGGHVENTPEETIDAYNGLIDAIEASGDRSLMGMNLYLGNEVYYYPSISQWIEEGTVNTLADSDYVLAEFGYGVDMRTLREAVNYIQGAGCVPILAHMERYQPLSDDRAAHDNIRELVRMGALMQINAETILGDSGYKKKHLAKWALKNEYVHFIATDAHSLHHRAPNLQDAAQYIAKHYSLDYAMELMRHNPKCIINNIDITE